MLQIKLFQFAQTLQSLTDELHELIAHLVLGKRQLGQSGTVELQNGQDLLSVLEEVEHHQLEAQVLQALVGLELVADHCQLLLSEIVHIVNSERLQLWQVGEHLSKLDGGHVLEENVLGGLLVQSVHRDLVNGATLDLEVFSLVEF